MALRASRVLGPWPVAIALSNVPLPLARLSKLTPIGFFPTRPGPSQGQWGVPTRDVL
jgi:hypothetical protein